MHWAYEDWTHNPRAYCIWMEYTASGYGNVGWATHTWLMGDAVGRQQEGCGMWHSCHGNWLWEWLYLALKVEVRWEWGELSMNHELALFSFETGKRYLLLQVQVSSSHWNYIYFIKLKKNAFTRTRKWDHLTGVGHIDCVWSHSSAIPAL